MDCCQAGEESLHPSVCYVGPCGLEVCHEEWQRTGLVNPGIPEVLKNCAERGEYGILCVGCWQASKEDNKVAEGRHHRRC